MGWPREASKSSETSKVSEKNETSETTEASQMSETIQRNKFYSIPKNLFNKTKQSLEPPSPTT